MADALASGQLNLISNHIKSLVREQSNTNRKLDDLIKAINALTEKIDELGKGKDVK